MTIFGHTEFDGHELVQFVHDPASGLRAIIAIHSTVLGPAGGGIRFFPYESEAAAVADVLRLSKAMTNKMAIGGLPLGGGKSVIIGHPSTDKTEALLEAFGEAVERLGGRYICGEDVGMRPEDMDVVARRTGHARGTSTGSGDTAPLTAHTVFSAILAAVAHRSGRPVLAGHRVAIQGVGAVGARVAVLVAGAGAEVLVADVDRGAVERVVAEVGATPVDVDEILAADVDVLVPCALGGVLSARTIPTIRASVVCGAANNQLATSADAERLHTAGILFVPDYVANIGGAYSAVVGGADRARRVADGVGPRVAQLLAEADAAGISPSAAADRRVAEILAAAR
ncbi:MAG: Glu/Leu/Phe/Val dehydrogenase dimerization domain-containing protein [Acidimicrobiia bacterium]